MDQDIMDQGYYDVCVVGAGIMGSATARHLAKLGKKTLLLDQFPLPHWRGSSHGQTRIIRCTYGEPYFCKMANDALKMWKEIEKEAGEKILHENIGMLEVEQQPGENLKIAKEHLKNNNVAYQELTSKSMKEKFPEIEYGPEYSAILEKSAGILMADKCVKNLQQQFIECGGTLHDNNKVIAIQPDSKGVTIITHQLSYRATKLVLTAGPWTNQLLKPLDIQLEITPVQAPVCYWKIMKPEAYDYRRFPTFVDMSEAAGFYNIYGLPSLEYPGLLKMGPTGESQGEAFQIATDPDKRDSNRKAVEAFTSSTSDYIKEHFPCVDYRAPAIVEMCMYTTTRNRNFIIDKHPHYDNVLIGAGFSAHGFKHAPVVGKILSELALDQKTSYDISHFRISKFMQQTPKSSL